jgi:hypothetical protein
LSSVNLSTFFTCRIERTLYSGADKSLARPGRKKATAKEDFDVHISYLLSGGIGGILLLFINITRLASNEIF